MPAGSRDRGRPRILDSIKRRRLQLAPLWRRRDQVATGRLGRKVTGVGLAVAAVPRGDEAVPLADINARCSDARNAVPVSAFAPLSTQPFRPTG